MSSGSGLKLIPIPNPRPIAQPGPIQEPMIINAPNPIADPLVIPSSTVVNFDFEDSNMIGWVAIDEPPELLGGEWPSRWGILDGPISGKALSQTRNIWGDKADVVPLGTFAIYDLQEWYNFVMEFDFFARDNDGLGMVWGWRNRTNHFRFFTMVDPANPAGAPPEKRAPFSMIERRRSDTSPYYYALASMRQASYRENEITHYKLEVVDRIFKVYWNGTLTMQVRAPGYRGGKIGFVLYAHTEIYFDNVRIESL